MEDSSHRSRSPLVIAIAAILVSACANRGSNNAPADEAAARLEPVTDAAGIATEDRCDLGFNTARFNETADLVHHQQAGHRNVGSVDFTLEQWAEVFVDESLGMTADAVVGELQGRDIYRRHILGGVLTHTLDPDPWMPMTDPGQCEALAAELSAARAVVSRYPTVADARAAGYVQGDTYYAGLGVHFQNWDYLEAFEPDQPVQLLYDGSADDATVVGLSYVVTLLGDAPPVGFSGDNDLWHRHRAFCLDSEQVNLSADVLSPEECAALAGTHIPNDTAWMLHVWVAPGCENDWGIFSAANPRLPYLPDGAPFAAACNSGKSTSDALDLDDRGGGPDIL